MPGPLEKIFCFWTSYKWIFSLLRSFNRGAASNRLSEAHTEWLGAQIWSEKWRFAKLSDSRERALLTVDQRWVGGQSVQLVGMRRSTKRVQLHAITRQSQACCAHKPHTHINGVTFEPHPQCLLSGPFSCIYHVKELNSIQLNRLQRCHCGVTHSDQL